MKSIPLVAMLLLSLVCALPILVFAKATSSPGQILFEGTGSGTFNSQEMPFGFSVRCYGANCVGAVALGSSSSVSYVTGTVVQVQQDTYMLSVSSSKVPSGTLPPSTSPNVACSLVNAAPITSGGTNTVTMTCSSPAGSGAATDAIVDVIPSSK